MKKLVVLCILAMTTVCSTLQAQKHYIGGTVGLNYQYLDGDSGVGFVLSPEYGYRFNDRWAMGGNMEISFISRNGDNMTGLTLSPYARNTFARVKRFEFFAEGVLGYMVMGNGGGPDQGFTLAIRPGILYKAKRVDFTAKLNLLQYSYMSDLGSFVNLSFGNTLSIGIVRNF